ncbi:MULTISPECIES: mechanosensitive ion channel family protein [Thioclava]|uniref:Small-conductance mechanosensitive channel n=1 Tax=Thioclava nitratireducens TaxID=1915078 RepID=A0ABM6ICN0_9RHOB|nr:MULTISPECIES: mechanosensitive ion channel domain-containing protein [Thioclava]AQS46444.1 mechanosensitive ion channel protein MscS [Thioclava nitratireducens]OWY02536.1 mechanosensitive ion channel protein MscS [Thioclava sp. F1Mire-8]OWY08198.1 mechanosensitive ion channel protein MscS [Thioclava sp. F42-5]OWY12972.1 mechanosensitive ion channel protein MscS [Thioclava sp. F34-6]OWY16393.1 mechanosensitive ion channel protein MscS [Thioclava sp. JM3]
MNFNDLTDVSAWLTQDRIDAAIMVAVNVVAALVILLVAMAISAWAKRRIVALSQRYKRLDDTLFGFLGNMVKYLILAIGVIFILNRFGIQTTSLAALVGAAGLAIGLALQGTLSNLAAGVMIILFRPFRQGDYIAAGSESGTVTEIQLFYTVLTTYDGIQIIVPNSDIWSSAITNYSANPTRMMDLTIGVAYDADLKKTQEVLEKISLSDPRALPEPAPVIRVKQLGDSSVDFTFRVWATTADFWGLQAEYTRKIKEEFDANGIGIPFPTRTLEVVQVPKIETRSVTRESGAA